MRRLTRRRPFDEVAAERLTQLEVNGGRHEVRHAAGDTLLTVLREQLGLRGTKLACGNGECGACTVLIDGQPSAACVVLAARVAGRIETIEGLAEHTQRLREAFADTGAFQCGYCTPGQVVRAAAMLANDTIPTDDAELRHQLAGNLCRCTGYAAIIRAIRIAAEARSSR
ncbi:MAG: (2Fe-2S)-binding protein [Pseudonocardia sp.]|nr:(2Fe-2S)-binding protein [Pseudonocardia sp.]